MLMMCEACGFLCSTESNALSQNFDNCHGLTSLFVTEEMSQA